MLYSINNIIGSLIRVRYYVNINFFFLLWQYWILFNGLQIMLQNNYQKLC